MGRADLISHSCYPLRFSSRLFCVNVDDDDDDDDEQKSSLSIDHARVRLLTSAVEPVRSKAPVQRGEHKRTARLSSAITALEDEHVAELGISRETLDILN